MKFRQTLACLLLAACNKPANDQTTDTSSDAAIAKRAAEITAAADAEVNKSLAEIDADAASANAATASSDRK